MATPRLVGREYVRVSRSRQGRSRSIPEQHDDNQRAADTLGCDLADPYGDVGSASRFGRALRGNFGRLLADLAADEFGADLLVLWESSRGSRQVSEWVRLLELCEQRSVRIFVTTHSRIYDPANPRDRRSLLEDAVDAEYEVGKMSQRIRRSAAANAAAGRPHGIAPFGLQRLFDATTKQFITQEAEPSEAPLVVELFERLAKGHTLKAIAKDWELRGVRTRSGTVWQATHLRRMALNPTYAGRRLHDPGRSGGDPGPDAAVYDALWDGIVDGELASRVWFRLTDPARRSTRPGGAVHLLSRIAVCGVCVELVVADRSDYSCRRGCFRVVQVGMDELGERLLLAALSREDVFTSMASVDNADAELAAVRVRIGDLRTQLGDLEAAVAELKVSVEFASRTEPTLRTKLRAAEREARALEVPSTLRGLIEPGPGVKVQWDVAPMSTRRELARGLFRADRLGEFRITKSPVPNRRVPAWRRVVLAREGSVRALSEVD